MASVWDQLDDFLDMPSSFSFEDDARGTIHTPDGTNVDEDVEALRDAIEGIGTKEKTLVDILAHRTNAQRQRISEAYKKATNRALVDDLRGDTVGDFERLMVALVTPTAQYDCNEITDAMEVCGTKDDVLIEIFASRSNKQIKAFSDIYLREHEKLLKFDLKKEVSGDFGKALLILAEGEREQNKDEKDGRAKEDAKILHQAGEKKWGTDEDKFIEILCQKSIPHLRQVLVAYKKLSGKTLQDSIKSEISGNLEQLLVAVVKCVKDVPAYLAEKLHASMKGCGTDERTLTRIMVSRSEVDLADIKEEYKKLYKETLYAAIESDVSGPYGDCLKIICGVE